MVEADRTGVRSAASDRGGRAFRPAGLLDEAEDFVDGFAGSVSRRLHKGVLKRAFEDGDLDQRALGLCAARSVDDFDDAIALYVRLGTGQSFDDFAGDQLEELRDDTRDFGGSVFEDADRFVDGAFDEIGDTAADVVDDVGDAADDVVDFVGDLF